MKKTEIINATVTLETKAKLQEIAKRKEWTLSHTINRILEDYQKDDKKDITGSRPLKNNMTRSRPLKNNMTGSRPDKNQKGENK